MRPSDSPRVCSGSLSLVVCGQGPNHEGKRLIVLLFINKRLVESPAIRKAVEEAYSPVLPKGAHPFVYLAITMPPASLDVRAGTRS